ncbi:DUF4838 domain-containing protein [bacterium]|nr:DUF4838 domain-containing protein [bacterium]
MRTTTCFLTACLLAFLTFPAPLPAATLVAAGQARAVIVLPAAPDEHEQRAANDLAEYLGRMSGAEIATNLVDATGLAAFLAAAKTKNQVPIVLGRLALPQLQPLLGDRAAVGGAFALRVTPAAVFAAGPVEGTYYAAIELLEQLGCRWFMPGDLGTVVPSLKTVTVRDQETVQAPSFRDRWFQMPDRDWQMRVRCGGEFFGGGHGIPTPTVTVNKETGAIEPAEYAEFFSLYQGKRTTRQHCVSNPKFIAYVVAELKKARQAGKGPILPCGPNDGAGFCECANCQALDTGDWDPFSNERSVTDRYIWFYNQILKGVEDEYPDTKLAFYIYHTYMRPPQRVKPDPRIIGALAPIAVDRVHGFSNPIAPEKSYVRWLFQEWGKIMPELYDRGYWSNLACPGFPFIIVDRLRDEIPACHELGVKGWRVETFPNYGPNFPSMYIAGKLMWNHQADVDALLEDCFDKFFGPAARPMGEYIRLMDAALRDADHTTGCSWDMPFFYPAALRTKARSLLAKGRRLAARQGVYEDRVRMITETFEMLEAFIGMLDARVQLDFVTEKKNLDELDAVANKLMAYEPVPMLSAGRFSTYVNYMNRFYRPCTEQGYARVTGGNRLVATAKDEWQFQIDPLKVGEDIGLWRPETTGGNWQTIKTSSSSWSNQGLRYYKGLAWYRQTVEVPAPFVGQRVFLWCGGIDEAAKVWVNGKVIGISHQATFLPFELDATAAIRSGQNVIVFCVNNEIVNELGTGGIVAPVMLYAPKDGQDAKLENLRALKPTFP